MAVSREKESLAKVLAHEGGYVNHPADPGGPTNKGVTQRVYDGYRKGKGLAKRSVKSITMDEVGEIYDRQYWDAVKGDLLPDGVDYVVFDGGVNSGPGRSIMWLQQALRPIYTGPIDGVMGVGTLAALKAVNNNDALIDRICDLAHELPSPSRHVPDLRQGLDSARCRSARDRQGMGDRRDAAGRQLRRRRSGKGAGRGCQGGAIDSAGRFGDRWWRRRRWARWHVN
ncbi:glycoside hydrolase family 108 protein [Mesorhizobium sp. ORM16]|uniref:glycoside hydrolase family 108 protein n=1 Tax=Mesorhizobium sp. ORM16 TaxID=3376989 RepID=UPI0038578635